MLVSSLTLVAYAGLFAPASAARAGAAQGLGVWRIMRGYGPRARSPAWAVSLPQLGGPRARTPALGLRALPMRRGSARLLVSVRAPSDLAPVMRAVVRLGGRRLAPIAELGVIGVTTSHPGSFSARLARSPGVAAIEPNQPVKLNAEPADGIDPQSGIPYDWAYDAVRAGPALAAVGGGSRRIIAVIDTGVDSGHPDIAAQLLPQYNAGSSRYRDADPVGHGTFIAGEIGMIDGNGIGGKGVAGASRILPIGALSEENPEELSEEGIARGINFAVNSGAKIISLSESKPSHLDAEDRAIARAFDRGVLVVDGAGNSAQEGNPVEFPPGDLGGLRGDIGMGLAVAATTPDDQPAYFSEHNDFISIAAPGSSAPGRGDAVCNGLFSTIPRNPAFLFEDPNRCARVFGALGDPGGRWAEGSGTSYAGPLVAGIAALAWQAEPRLRPEQVGHVLTRSARQTYGRARWNRHTGAGVVDGAAAVALARVYDLTPPTATVRFRFHRDGRSRQLHVRVSAGRDRTEPGRELAGQVVFTVDNLDTGIELGRSRPGASNISGTFTGHTRHLHHIGVTACDANENCRLLAATHKRF
jgi:subtilisin family serine protease